MSGVNKVILVGRLARDVELKYAANGNAIANVNLVTSEEWKDKNTGEKQEKAEFHRVVIFGKLAEIAGQYLTKGSQVYFEGKLQTRKWQDNNTGQDRYSTEVVIDGFSGTMQMLGGGNNQGGQTGGQQQGAQNTQQAPMQQPPQSNQHQQASGFQQPAQQEPAYPANDFDDMNVPF